MRRVSVTHLYELFAIPHALFALISLIFTPWPLLTVICMVKYCCIDITSSNGASNAKKYDSQLPSNGGLFTLLIFIFL